MGCATTRSKAATAIQRWSRVTAGICWLCMLRRRPPDERARSTVALPRLVRRMAVLREIALQLRGIDAVAVGVHGIVGWRAEHGRELAIELDQLLSDCASFIGT